MPDELVPVDGIADKSLVSAVSAAAEFIAASTSENTRRAYASDWRDFCAWCDSYALTSLPALPGSIAAYLAALAKAGARLSTIRRRLAAIGDRHRKADHENPTTHPGVKATLEGIARTIGSAPVKKSALTAELLARALRKIPADLAGLRDRALISIGFAAAMRRTELVGLDLCDVSHHPKGIVLTVRKSKTDQAGAGTIKAVLHGRKLRPVAALQAWLALAQICDGPIFRGVRGDRVLPGRLSDRQVARIVQKRTAAIGLDPALFAGHSLRSGYITSADEHGASLASIANQAGHAKLDTTRGYVQVNDAFRDHSGKGFL